jgi:hypothetical protein
MSLKTPPEARSAYWSPCSENPAARLRVNKISALYNDEFKFKAKTSVFSQ